MNFNLDWKFIILIFQLVGFAVLLVGMCSYNNILFPQLMKKLQYRICRHRPPVQEDKRVINTAADDVEDLISQ